MLVPVIAICCVTILYPIFFVLLASFKTDAYEKAKIEGDAVNEKMNELLAQSSDNLHDYQTEWYRSMKR